MSVTGTIIGTEGASAAVSSPFQVANCANLAFKPVFTASTQGKASKADGASLHVKVVPPAEGPQNSSNGSSGEGGSGDANQTKPEEANIKSVKVELPEQLPSRLTTLQKACTSAQFNSNPAGCPSASMVGVAVARTPLLSNALTGPAYFVSHGNEAFPQLIIVLQGEGITVDLVGDTFISKAGITSSTFPAVPDVPVSSFELTLPQGPYSALAANAPLCAQPLSMPTEFTGQNGAVLKQDTPIEVDGCSNTISVSAKKIKKRTATLKIYVPEKGKVKISGKGVSSVTKTVGQRNTITVNLDQKKSGKLTTGVTITFTPAKGHHQSKHLKLHFRK
jgi:hypothetical protein